MKNIFFFLFPLLMAWGQNLAAQNREPSAKSSELSQLCIEFRADSRSLYRFYHIPHSPERRARFQTFYESYLERLEKFSFENLSTGGKVDYVLLQNYLQDQQFRFSQEKEEYEQVRTWVQPGEMLYQLEKLRRRGKHLDAPRVAAQLDSVLRKFKDLSQKITRENLRLLPRLSRRAKGIIEGQNEALKSVFDFYKDYDPQFTWWISQPYQALSQSLEQYANLLESRVDSSTLAKDDGSGIIGQPIGEAELMRLLKYEMIPYGPEKLVEIAHREFAWCDAELLKASQEMGFGKNWKAAQEKVKQSFVPPGKQPEAMLQLYNESVAFLKEHQLLSIPPLAEETWRMRMISPERQKISPFFLGGEVLQISYPTDEMSHEEKMMSMRGNNPHFSRATVHHELIAGHHLQQFMNNRYQTHRFFSTPFWTEGWALYWELRLWDMNFPQSPEDRIGMLFWRMHRCARIIFSLNYHLGKWTPQECIDFLVDRVGHERANAEGEVRRSFTGNYGPLYQIAYMLGGLQFYALQKELVGSGKMSDQEFHDAVLRQNSMPIEMLRAILKDEAPQKNFKTQWKFDDGR